MKIRKNGNVGRPAEGRIRVCIQISEKALKELDRLRKGSPRGKYLEAHLLGQDLQAAPTKSATTAQPKPDILPATSANITVRLPPWAGPIPPMAVIQVAAAALMPAGRTVIIREQWAPTELIHRTPTRILLRRWAAMPGALAAARMRPSWRKCVNRSGRIPRSP